MRSILTILLLAAVAAPSTGVQIQVDELSRGHDPFVRSLLWPGLGQIEQGRRGIGVAFAGGAVLAVAGSFISHISYHSAALDYENAGKAYANAIDSGNTDIAWYYFQQLEPLYQEAEDRQDTRRLWFAGLGSLWVANLLDVWWHERGGDDRLAFVPVAGKGRSGLALTYEF